MQKRGVPFFSCAPNPRIAGKKQKNDLQYHLLYEIISLNSILAKFPPKMTEKRGVYPMTLSDRAIQQLLHLITVQKQYHPGDKLPNENTLARELGVSRTTMRAAVQNLVSQGVLEIQIGRGTYVARESKIQEDFGFDSLKYVHLKLRDLYELRAMLEPQMAYYAALRATDEELKQIAELGNLLQDNHRVRSEDAEGNRLFHNAIARATHNEFGVKLIEILNTALVWAFQESGVAQTIDTDSLLDHQLIMDYLRKRDPEGARLAMDLHMKHSTEEYAL